MIVTSAERALVHLLPYAHAREAGRDVTQVGIADGARILRSHVPRTVRALMQEGLVESKEARLPGKTRRTTVYALTPAGVSRAREILTRIDGLAAEVDGRATTLGDARKALGLSPLEAAAALDAEGRLAAVPPPSETKALLQRDGDLGFLRRWHAGGVPIAVVYGSKGMGKTALGRAFTRTVARSAWLDVGGAADLPTFAQALERATGRKSADPEDPASVAEALLSAYNQGVPVLVVDGYGEVPEGIVDALTAIVRNAGRDSRVKLLVLAQETTPAYCRFYGKGDVDGGLVTERHLKGLDLDGCRAMLGNPAIEPDGLRRIFLLTKGCPLYLEYIREGDEYGLKQNSRFTKAEIRLLLYSGRASP